MNLKALLFFLFLLINVYCFAQTGSIKGTITDDKTGEKLVGASVNLIGTNQGASTDVSGNYLIGNIKPGSYTVKVNFVGYDQFNKKIVLGANQNVVLNINLSQSSGSLKEVNIFGTINKESDKSSRTTEKDANNILNVVGAVAIQKSPDINAANILARVSGVTLQKNSGGDDAFIVIRGIEPRYNNTLINGIKISSPDDKSRSISLDVVPSDLLQRIEVSKSLTPEMEGDAIGGTTNLIFKDAPDNQLFNISGSIGYSALFLDRKFRDFSKSDIQQQSVYDRFGPTYPAKATDFSNSNLDFKQVTAPPNSVFSFAYGNRYLDKKLGFLIADNFQNQYFGNNSQLNQAVANPQNNYLPYETDIANRFFSNQQLNNGLVVHLDYAINARNKILIDNVLLYTYFSQAYLSIDTTLVGGDAGRTLYRNKPVQGTGSIHEDNISTINHQLLENIKIAGKDILSNKLLLDWTAAFSDASKKAPDRANYTTNKRIWYDSLANVFNSTPYYYDGGTRIWQHNEDKDLSGILGLTYRGKVNDADLELKIGGLYRHKERNNFQNQYNQFAVGGDNSIGSRQQFTDIYHARDSIINPNGSAGFDLNNYHLYENISATYIQFKLSTDKLSLTGGARLENTEQGYNFLSFELDAPNYVSNIYSDLLPSLQAKYQLNTKSNFRASYFKSLARPGYYEVLPVSQPANNDGTSEKGNSGLEHTTADNYDIRYEFFPKPDQQLFIGGFYKELQNPIEYSFVDSYTFKPTNSKTAVIYGVEIIYNRFFGNIGINANYAYTHSNVNGKKLDPQTSLVTYQDRQLQGQPNNELNLSLEYKNEKKKFFMQLAYQYNGQTLYRVNPDLGYDYFKQAQSFLSFSLDKAINKHLLMFGKFNNLLNTATIIKTYNITTGYDYTKASGLIGLRYSR